MNKLLETIKPLLLVIALILTLISAYYGFQSNYKLAAIGWNSVTIFLWLRLLLEFLYVETNNKKNV